MLGVQAVNLAAVQASVAAGMRVGMPAGAQPAPAPQPAAPAPHAPPMNATMLGMPAVQLAQLQAAQSPAAPVVQPAAPQPAAPQPAAPREKMANATMLGMPAVTLPQPAAALPGVAFVASPSIAKPAASPAPVASFPSAAQPASRPSIAAQTNRTMLGVSIPLSEILPPELAEPPPAPAPPPTSAWDTNTSSAGLSSPNLSQDSLEIPGGRRAGRGLLVAAIAVVALLVLAASGVGLYVALRGGGPEVHVEADRVGADDVLVVTVPGAAAGTKLRYGNVERPLAGGRATFPLAPDALRVGDNVITVVVLAPGEDPVSRDITLQFHYRARADLSGLAAVQPALSIVVDAKPGSVVMLDGTPLLLDAAGHGTRPYPLDVAAARGGTITHVARYLITPPGGAAVQGAVTTEVPVTRASIDRPGLSLVTDRDVVEVAGRVEAGGTITVDGVAVPVRDGKFVHRLAVAAVGTQTPRIVASAPGKAALPLALTIRRVTSLAEEARGFVPERGVTYARLRPAVASFVGKRVAFEGRVALVEVSGEKSELQIIVRDCPRGEGCPLWVEIASGTDVSEGATVRVLGTVGGERRYTSQSGEELVAPRVDAAFVLPLAR